MKVISLSIKDYKRISAVSLIPEGNSVLLTGDNGAGKSSVLDAIVEAVNGSVATHPIREGADSTTITLTIGGEAQTYTVRRRITQAGSYLDITTADGLKVPKAATFLAGLVGQLSFDPEAFARLKPTDQAEQLRRAVGLDTSAIDTRIAALFATRRDTARDAKTAAAAVPPQPASMEKREEVSVADLTAEAERLASAKTILGGLINAEAHAKAELEAAKKYVDEARAALERAERNLATAQEKHTDAADRLANNDALAEGQRIEARLAELRGQYKTVDTTNREARAHNAAVDAFTKAKARADELTDAAATLDAQLTEAREAREKLIRSAPFPVPGLSITDAGVVLNGIPFADLNTAERIKISTLIAMAANPKLRVIFVREGALINRANLKIITDLAKERGYQVWVEKFQEEAGTEGIHIVDGGVATIDGKPVEAPVTATSVPE